MADPNDPDFLRAEIARLRAEADQREAAAAQYQQLQKAKATKQNVAQPIANLVDMSKQVAFAQNPPDVDAQNAIPSLTTMPADDAADLQRRGVSKGAFATTNPNTSLTRNIEAFAGKRGFHEDVGGDQRVVLDDQGNAVATRAEYPSLAEHWNALGPEGKASKFGFFLNAIQAPARAVATMGNIGGSALRGLPTPSLSESARDVGEAFMNEKGHTVAEGGPVTSRGSGFGDLFRAMREKILAQNPNATLGDLMLAGPAYESVTVPIMTKLAGGAFPEDHPLSSKRRLADIDPNDPLFDFGGEATAVVADPLNVLPVDKALAPVGKAISFGASKAAPFVPQGVKDAAIALNNSPNALKAMLTGAGKSERQITKGLVEAGEEAVDAAHIADQTATVKQRVRSEQQVANDEGLQRLGAAAGAANSTDDAAVNALREGKGAPLVNTRSPEEQLDVLADVGGKHFDKLTSAEQELLRPVLAAKAAGQPLIDAASKDLLLSTHAIAEHLKAAEPDVVERLFQEHPWKVGDANQRRQLSFAKSLIHEDRLDLQRAQRVSLMGPTVSGAGHIPRPPRSVEATFLAQNGVPERVVRGVERHLDPILSRPGYDPFKNRAMAQMVDADIVRRAADSLVRAGITKNGAFINNFGKGQAALVEEFARNTSLQADHAARDTVRNIIEGAWGKKLPQTEGAITEAQGLVGRRGSEVAGFVQDPITQMAAQKQAAAPRLMNAEMGQRMLSVVDTKDRAIVQSLDDALHTPRTGGADATLLKRRYDNGVRREGQFWQRAPVVHDGKVVGYKSLLPDDVSKFLDDRKLHFIGEDDELGHAMPALRGKVVPRAIYKDLKETAQRLNPGVLERVANVLAKATNWWAPIVLNSPGFHTRNAFFGMFQTFLANGSAIMDRTIWKLAGDVGKLAEHNGLSDAVLHVGGKDWRLADLASEARSFGIFEGGRAADIERAARSKVFYADEPVRRLLGKLNPANDTGLIGGEQFFKKTVSRGMGAAMSGRAITAENAQRLFTYLNHRVNLGESASEAAKAVVKFHFDYTGSHLSQGEKVLRKFFPFYQWVKQSTMLTVEQMLRHPDKYAAINHLYEAFSRAGEDKNVDPRMHPSYIDETGSVHVPGIADDAERQFFGTMERPGTQLSWAQPGQMALGLASQLGPGPKFALERMTGKSMFGDRPVDQNFSPERASPLEYAFGMNSQNIPAYAARNLIGGIPGTLLNDVIFPQVKPEWSNQTAKVTGGDQNTRLLQRLVSMVLGPRLSVTRPLDVQTNNRAQWRDQYDKQIGETKERNARQRQPKPTDFFFSR